MRKILTAASVGLGLFITPVAIVQGASEVEYSEAQEALFGTPHLDNIAQPVTLEYEYRREAGPEDSFVDSVSMTVTEIAPDGGKNVSFEYLTGENRRPYVDMAGFHGNPLIMIFLEDDLLRMKEKLGGGGVYMRNRIRHAFYDGSRVQKLTFELGGRTVEGTKIEITPFLGDQKQNELGEFEKKRYEFVVSPEVPGGVFRILSIVPGSAPGKTPLARDELTFRGIGS